MSFLGGAECSTAGNPLTQFTKHVQDDKSLQRDRLVGRGPGMQEGMRSQGMMGGHDQMMDEFAQQSAQLPGGVNQQMRMEMEQVRHQLEQFQQTPRTGSPGWAAEFDPGDHARMEAAFAGPKGPMMNNSSGFTPAEFARFQQQSTMSVPQSASPVTAGQSPMMSGYQRPMGMGYMGYGGMGMMQPGYSPMMHQQQHQQPAEATAQDKGKGRMIELDDENWEAQFKQIELADNEQLDDEANAAIEAEMNDLDRSVHQTSDNLEDKFRGMEEAWERAQAEVATNRKLAEGVNDFDINDNLHMGDMSEWDGFDNLTTRFKEPRLGDYTFEEENVFRNVTNPFEEGMKIMQEGGNLSLAALAFEAAVQKDHEHVKAWTMLGTAQAQNEKELPAIRALEQALKVDPNNLDALMGLAVSYTNEGYDSTAYRTLERWLSVKYPQIINPDNLSSDADLGFTDRQILHERVTDLFIQAAQLSPSGAQMDPDVQVGLGVLFYCAEEYEKAVDCFTTALASTESGTTNQKEQLHLLWNRLGATLANSGRSEEAIEAYEQALNINANFVRARYNLGVSCINIGCYPEAAQHLLGALSMHRVVAEEGRERAREIIGGGDGSGITDEQLDHIVHQNQSTNLYDTLRRVFSQMGRRDLADMVESGMDVNVFRKDFEF
ncbi:Putative Tetratricopeptide repeat protein [Aspergillus calidoustus]|uniref:Peroxisomal targeting signal receptor n=1 Tax=Aspergillus calidoustus TaxID=454130 RepID=A0A0U5GAP4_ASPCI|nr:Putative Tetratricopeptide repeat protein [Aspergillus calidoustus]